ncbi:MAG: hypothetical protein RL260_3658 [Pseudomonadota bacterium]|jgi:hypothetical protein
MLFCMEDYAQQLRSQWLGQPFGDIRFWGFAVVRPNDQSFVTVAVQQTEAERLDLTLLHASRQGLPQVLSIWSPRGLRIEQDQGLVVEQAMRVSWGDCDAWSEDGMCYRLRTPRGEGSFPMHMVPALRLGC